MHSDTLAENPELQLVDQDMISQVLEMLGSHVEQTALDLLRNVAIHGKCLALFPSNCSPLFRRSPCKTIQ
jgi:hypothetical protein